VGFRYADNPLKNENWVFVFFFYFVVVGEIDNNVLVTQDLYVERVSSGNWFTHCDLCFAFGLDHERGQMYRNGLR
jgi:hypothetical protein